MPSIALRSEAKQLYRLSDRLDSMVQQYPVVSEALITISGSVRLYGNSVAGCRLQVLVATKIAPLSGLDPADA
jgi:hypothetical protein